MTSPHEWQPGEIFVFGSNIIGRHGAGAAKEAVVRHGAIMGIGIGRQGNSYAIPTKETPYKTLPLGVIQHYVKGFLDYAYDAPHLKFFVTRIGCGFAGYTDQQIAPMFANATANCRLPPEWRK